MNIDDNMKVWFQPENAGNTCTFFRKVQVNVQAIPLWLDLST
jgi:hypothetical protein